MKTALITGAARGIGLATTDILCAQGWHVVMVDRDAEELMARASERHAVTAAVHDISDPGQVDKMIAVTLAARGQIDAWSITPGSQILVRSSKPPSPVGGG